MSLARRIFHEKRRLIYPLVIALLVNAALFAAVVYPLSMKVAAGEQSAQTATLALTAARKDYESARDTATGKVAADTELKKFYGDVLPPDQSAARRIIDLKIQQLAKKANVNYQSATNDPSPQHDSTLGKLSTTATLSGQYRDIRHFLYEIETAPEFLIIEMVTLSQGAETSTVLNVTVKVSTYYQAGGNGN
jgi:Tfp pilus assembly protein PilO